MGKSLCEKHTGKAVCIPEKGIWKVCTTTDIKEEKCRELEKLKQSACLVPLPLYACEFIKLKIAKVTDGIRKAVGSSVTVSIHEREESPGVVLTAERKSMKRAVQWLQDIVLKLEVREKTVTAD